MNAKRQKRRVIAAHEATLTTMAESPRASIGLTSEQWERVQEIQRTADLKRLSKPKPRIRWTGRWWEIKWQPRFGITNTWGGHTFREACEFAEYLAARP